MDEQNNLDGGITLNGPWSQAFNMGLTANYDRDRTNKRKFTTTDTLGRLLKGLSRQDRGVYYCDNRVVGENYVYPIAGRIGVYNTVHDFLKMAIFDSLSPATGGKTAALSDELTFVTTLAAGATPKVTFAQVGHGLQFAGASLSPNAQRKDTHDVTLGVALDPASAADVGALHEFAFAGKFPKVAAAAKPAKGAARPAAQLAQAAVVVAPNGAPLVAAPQTAAEVLALEQISAAKARQFTLVPAGQ
jgi:hypothetical protein